MSKQTDIDIDIADREKLLNILPHTPASMINGDIIKKHNVGVYIQEIPQFMDTGLSSIDYKEAGEYGYFKLDILNNSLYEPIKSEEHLNKMLSMSPDWSLLENKSVVEGLSQIGNYYNDLLKWKPKSVEELAMFIAMIRPSKKHLLNCANWEDVRKEIWVAPTDNSAYFKKSHSIAYAMGIVVQLNLIVESKNSVFGAWFIILHDFI